MKSALVLSLLAIVAAADKCCPVDIVRDSPSRSLFLPSLQSCPAKATYICSVADEKQTSTSIVINGKTTIATGKDGANSVAELVCRKSDLKWTLSSGQVVDTIACL